jgi:hypothetical protein
MTDHERGKECPNCASPDGCCCRKDEFVATVTPLKIEAGKKYRSAGGAVVTIGGPTTNHPGWFWSIGGDWYDIEGKFLFCLPPKWEYITNPDAHQNLKELA